MSGQLIMDFQECLRILRGISSWWVFSNISSWWVFQADKSGLSFAVAETSLGWSLLRQKMLLHHALRMKEGKIRRIYVGGKKK